MEVDKIVLKGFRYGKMVGMGCHNTVVVGKCHHMCCQAGTKYQDRVVLGGMKDHDLVILGGTKYHDRVVLASTKYHDGMVLGGTIYQDRLLLGGAKYLDTVVLGGTKYHDLVILSGTKYQDRVVLGVTKYDDQMVLDAKIYHDRIAEENCPSEGPVHQFQNEYRTISLPCSWTSWSLGGGEPEDVDSAALPASETLGEQGPPTPPIPSCTQIKH
ncbi:hypothetical protein AAG570_011317 [Ranatra chinensis]|uniref:Uncharacterized protein n=1 Tax=Ranatra chinensis TaxID=642074 RepID=A0ABD0YMF2_9HEMI